MIVVALLIFDEVVPSSITGVVDLLCGANRYMQRMGKEQVFQLQLVSETNSDQFRIFSSPDVVYTTFATTRPPALVIVPSFSVSNSGVLDRNKMAIQWIKEMHGAGAEIASLCVGCYFLAEAGLLCGKDATSHWAVVDDIQKRYPDVQVKSDLVITDNNGIYTSGGAFSSLKLIVYLIEKFCGREVALWMSKMYAIEPDTTSQAHFAVFTGQHQHNDKEILQAQQYIEQHYTEDVSMEKVAALVNMGNRNFIRRFKAATNNNPTEYLQRVRVEAAKKAIEKGNKELSAIIDDTGYQDIKTFRTVFKRITGLSPMDYKRKYARG